MFNSTLKKHALQIHENEINRYNSSYASMQKACEDLYSFRMQSVALIERIATVINSIANSPKEFSTKMGQVGKELEGFRQTEEYAKAAYDSSVKAGAGIAGGAAMGLRFAAMAPTAMMSFATTFGTATTGIAISELSGAAAQKAAAAWIGRTLAGFAVKEGAGMAVGNACLALAGPIGWGITAVTTGVSLIKLTKKNQKISDEAVEEAKKIDIAREALDETTEKVNTLREKTGTLYGDMNSEIDVIVSYENIDYMSISDDEKLFLGSIVNNTLSLSQLLNEVIM